MFARAFTTLPRRFPLRPAVPPPRRLLSNSPNIYQETRSPKIGLRFSAYTVAFAGCVTGAAAVVTLCEEDRLERWSDRWATGKVVRLVKFPDRIWRVVATTL